MEQRLPAILTLCGGIVFSLVLFLIVRGWEQERTRVEFERQAGNLATDLQKGIDSHLEVLQSIGRFYAASRHVERQEFRKFVKGILAEHRGIQALEWIPHITDSERGAFEAAARAEGHADFQITELNDKGEMVRAARREEYFPAHYVEPLVENERALGFDLGSNPDQLEALERARDTGKAVSTGRVTLQETGEHLGFLIFLPIYRNALPHRTLEERRENLHGLALTVIRIRDLVAASFEGLNLHGVDFHLYDDSAPPDQRLLNLWLQELGRTEKKVHPMGHMEKMIRSDLHLSVPLDVAGRRWSLLFHPAPGQYTSHGGWLAWGVLAGGLLFNGLLAAHLRSAWSHNAQTERLLEQVRQKTTEIKGANQRLSALYAVATTASESLKLDTVLQEVIKKITEIFHFDATRIFLIDQKTDALHLKASFENHPDLCSQVTTFRRGQGNTGKVAETGEAMIYENIQTDPRYQKLNPLKTPEMEKYSFLALFPIKSKLKTVGTISCIGQNPRRLEASEIQLISSIAVQIGAAVENTTLFEETVARASELATLYSIAKVVNQPLDFESLLRDVVDKVLEIFDFDAGRIYLLDGDGKELRLLVQKGFPEDLVVEATSYKLGEGIIGKVCQSGGPFFSEDIQTDLEFHRLTGEMILLRAGFRSSFFIPIKAKEKTVGVISFHSKVAHQPAPSEVELVRSIGDQVGIAIENAKLYEQTKKQALELERDIVERKKAEEERIKMEFQLRQAQKLEAVGQLAAGIAHEINTPTQYVGDNTCFLKDNFKNLISVLAKYEMLHQAAKHQDSVPEELVAEVESAMEEADIEYLTEEIPKAIEQSLDGVERISTIVQAMKEFAHPGIEEKVETDINHTIQNTVTVARSEWKYVADVVTDLDPSLPLVPCLQGEFNQVVLNLIVNAAHAIADVASDGDNGKGTITISTHADNGWAEVRIRDTGTGIPDAIKGKIFDPFFTTKKVGKGTGQGLAIAYAVITEKHDGTIDIDTEVGKGTTFILRLPLAPSPSAEDAGAREMSAEGAAGREPDSNFQRPV